MDGQHFYAFPIPLSHGRKMTNEQLAEAVVMMKGGGRKRGQSRDGRDLGLDLTGFYDVSKGSRRDAIPGTGSINSESDDFEYVRGVNVCDHRSMLRTYPNTFLGCEAVDWMRDTLRVSDADALKLGQVRWRWMIGCLGSVRVFF
jgi:hypothetical protein